MRKASICFFVFVLLGASTLVPTADASYHRNTVCDQIEQAEYVIIATVVSSSKSTTAPSGKGGCSTLRVREILKADKKSPGVQVGDQIESGYSPHLFDEGVTVIAFGEHSKNAFGVGSSTHWRALCGVTDEEQRVLPQLVAAAEDSLKRLRVLLPHIEGESKWLAEVAFDEYLHASFAELQSLASEFDSGKIAVWIAKPGVDVGRQRVYLEMLATCGSVDHVPLVKQLIADVNQEQHRGLGLLYEALICLMFFDFDEGFAYVDQHFLSNSDCIDEAAFFTIAAILFVDEHSDLVSPERKSAALYSVLYRPEIAYVAIDTLRDEQDWTQVERIVRTFDDDRVETRTLRPSIVRYLHECPLPKAVFHLQQLESIRPDVFAELRENGLLESSDRPKRAVKVEPILNPFGD